MVTVTTQAREGRSPPSTPGSRPRRTRPTAIDPDVLDPGGLLRIARGLAANATVADRPGPADGADRCWELIAAGEAWEAWIIGWPPGRSIELHDHGNAAGVVVVVSGVLVETAVVASGHGPATTSTRTLLPGTAVTMRRGHVHDIVNDGPEAALSVHVYGPRLTDMTYYRVSGGVLEPLRTVTYGSSEGRG
jgi:hypothetical protein